MILHAVLLLSFFVRCQCTEGGNNCFAKEKSTEVLDLAKDTLEKLKYLLPNYTNDLPSANTSECNVKEKALALLDIATDLISEAKRNYPNCFDEPVTDPVTVTDTMMVTDSVLPMDCDDVFQQGNKSSGIYSIWTKHDSSNKNSILVYCEMDVQGRGWTVIQRRGVNYTRQDFNQDWDTYKRGFGDLNGEFWLGNKNIHDLTYQADYMLQIDLEDVNGIQKYASYAYFWIENEDSSFKLHVQEYNGTAGDSMKHENITKFTTKDRSHHKKVDEVLCVESRATGWWYWGGSVCNGANLNGLPSTATPNDRKNLYWYEWKKYESLARAIMKIRRL